LKDRAAAQANTQKMRATLGLDSVADAVRQTGRQLRDQQQGTVADVVERAAAQIDRFSAHLDERDVAELVGDVERLARRQPAAFIGGSFAIGLLAARFLRSSANTGDFGFDRHNPAGFRQEAR
jgi:hypothetical protein